MPLVHQAMLKRHTVSQETTQQPINCSFIQWNVKKVFYLQHGLTPMTVHIFKLKVTVCPLTACCFIVSFQRKCADAQSQINKSWVIFYKTTQLQYKSLYKKKLRVLSPHNTFKASICKNTYTVGHTQTHSVYNIKMNNINCISYSEMRVILKLITEINEIN